MVEGVAVIEVLVVGSRKIEQFAGQSICIVEVAQVKGSVGSGSKTEKTRVGQASGGAEHVGTKTHRSPHGRR